MSESTRLHVIPCSENQPSARARKPTVVAFCSSRVPPGRPGGWRRRSRRAPSRSRRHGISLDASRRSFGDRPAQTWPVVLCRNGTCRPAFPIGTAEPAVWDRGFAVDPAPGHASPERRSREAPVGPWRYGGVFSAGGAAGRPAAIDAYRVSAAGCCEHFVDPPVLLRRHHGSAPATCRQCGG